MYVSVCDTLDALSCESYTVFSVFFLNFVKSQDNIYKEIFWQRYVSIYYFLKIGIMQASFLKHSIPERL